ncbi:MAG TPA: DUF5696 domain-containing protein [Virgibacillus sp.]|nr:DUF5696 domain-containing protein [Virgibacillus sp.]HLR68181.1 DUF5696 domain-containing protein [Virgibacillus sp.]
MTRKLKKVSLLCCLILLLGVNLKPPIGYAENANIEENDNNADIEENDESDAFDDPPTSLPTETEISDISNMELMASNHYLELYFNEENAEFAVKEKENGYIWYSNPKDRAIDPNASPEGKSYLSTQLAVKFFDSKGKTAQFDSYKDSVNEEQFNFEKVENGFKIVYTIGKESKGVEQIPEKISKERFHTLILDKLNEDDRNDIEKRFKFIEEEDLYERRDEAFSKLTLERTMEYLDEVEYTEEDLAFDNEEHGSEDEEDGAYPSFTIPLLVEIDGDHLVVTIDGEEIEYQELYPINELKVLPFLGAAGLEDEGYMFVPDGSGALIDLNNGKGSYDSFSAKIYGVDEADPVRSTNRRTINETIRMPVFGMKKGDHAFFGIVEEGDAMGNINAEISDSVNSYNAVSSSFIIKQVEEIRLQGGEQSNTTYAVQKGDFKDTIKIRYGFLDNEEANYNGMASYYQDYLEDKYNLEQLDSQGDIPFYLELSGAIRKRKSILGIPYRSLQPLTTFEQGEEIISELIDSNINNIKLRFTGWFNNGISHKIPTKVKVDRVLGGKEDLEQFNSFLLDNNVELYPDVAFAEVYQNTIGFSPTTHASRHIRREVVERKPINPATYRENNARNSYYILSPNHLSRSVDGFLSDYEKLNIDNVSLRDLGDKIHSDFRESKVVNREHSKEITEDQLGKINDEFTNVMGSGGNAFVFPYIEEIINVPTTSSQYNITDKTIPFYQMVIHGYFDYAGDPINLSPDQSTKVHVLKSLETGSNIHFSWFYEDGSTIKDTEYNDLISAHYNLWIDEAREMYEEVNSVLKEVKGEKITSHNELSQGVFETTYGDSLSVIVNYNNQSVSVDDITIEAESYRIR